jgi:Methyltransferase domain
VSATGIVGWRDHDLHAWQILRPLLDRGGYLPWTTGSMRPAGLVAVCNEIVHGARTRIVECGSGVSTVVLARLLRERGAGRLVALENDHHWATLIRGQLLREALDGIARVLDAPLDGHPPWYAPARVAEIPDTIDLLLVDGPPAYDPDHRTRRAPALPRLEPRLVAGAAVVLDDLARTGEREVLAGWEATTDWRFTVDADAGVAIGHRQHDTHPPKPTWTLRTSWSARAGAGSTQGSPGATPRGRGGTLGKAMHRTLAARGGSAHQGCPEPPP